jgi:ferrous iron transport protein A
MQILPLELLPAGQVGRVCDVSGQAALVHRLHEMGLREGTEIRVVRPGAPCIVAFEDHRLSVRLEDEVTILVECAS